MSDTESMITSTTNRISRFRIMELERDKRTGWQELHKKIIAYRCQHNLTILQFLKICKLSEYSWYKQLSCKSGYEYHPSDKVNSAGYLFVQAVKVFFDSIDSGTNIIDFSNFTTDIKDKVVDMKYDLRKEIISKNIINIEFIEDEIMVICLDSVDENTIKSYVVEKTNCNESDIIIKKVTLL